MKEKINAKIKEYKEIVKNTFSKDNIVAFFKETIDTVVFVIVAVVIIRFFIGELRWIPSGSMRMTLVEKDRFFGQSFIFLNFTFAQINNITFFAVFVN